jgi:hypothetical protein
MPYINKIDRNKTQYEIDLLVEKLKFSVPGEINYVFSSIIWHLFERRPSHTKANELLGVLEAVKQEFYRRKKLLLMRIQKSKKTETYDAMPEVR